LAAAVARGRRGGRKPVVTPEKLARAQALIAEGLNVREAAARVKVGKTALYEALVDKPVQAAS
jgi:DNA invertase Pin-like site-specific DNA recombinase